MGDDRKAQNQRMCEMAGMLKGKGPFGELTEEEVKMVEEVLADLDELLKEAIAYRKQIVLLSSKKRVDTPDDLFSKRLEKIREGNARSIEMIVAMINRLSARLVVS